ncbi:hypothetical protein [Lacticaseibacillus porcinae]|uniref:hypothetical protein n=1 Tax=Lacticaseibacillus porcinae TaxID=1123687 RepID=UPI000F7B529A|nr:hypothetical protein [Lacticaseibacillus porcinae]
MRLSEYIKLPYSAKILALYLHVSNPTYKKLVTKQTVQRTVIKQLMPKLQLDRSLILAHLDSLKAAQLPFEPPVLAIDELKVTSHAPIANIEKHVNMFVIEDSKGPNDELIVCATKSSATMRRRVNQSLYSGRWPQLEACPREQLTSDQLVA